MQEKELLEELVKTDCLDLPKLYQSLPEHHFYSLIKAFYEVRKSHNLDTRISALKTEIESLTKTLNTSSITEAQLTELIETLDFNQRAHKMSRYILTQDNHHAFANQVDIVMYGDSITEWGPWHDALTGFKLANRGLAGDTTQGMLGRLHTTTACSPELVCVMAGINDLAQGYSIETILENYEQMLSHWQQNQVEVWVQSTLYVGKNMLSLNPHVTELNLGLQTLAQQYEHSFIDLNSTLCPDGVLPLDSSCDDLHLNSTAYQRWLDVISPMLENRFINK